MTVYLESLHRALPRLLSSFNADPTSRLAGVGDRFHWAWKMIDFPNGTFQGAVHGLAVLVRLGALPEYVTEAALLKRMALTVQGLEAITARNGSLDEALPGEASFCVTALVASEVLAARSLLGDRLSSTDQADWLEAVRPLIRFLLRQDEHHGLISNHLASAALAMYRWHAVTGEGRAESRGRMWLDRLFAHQSSEGWFNEYGGPDPGYQTWCTTQLAQLHSLRPDLGLAEPLSRSLEFLAYAAHPDGSFGGSYGWRNTRFLLPGGIELLAAEDSHAAALAAFARDSIARNACVTLDCVDAGNLTPFFNDYALALWAERTQPSRAEPAELPCHASTGRYWHSEAGWLIDRGSDYYSLINLKRGGSCVHFYQGCRRVDDPGAVVRDRHRRLYCSQLSEADALPNAPPSDDSFRVRFAMRPVRRPVPGPVEFVTLRLMGMTVFKSLVLGNFVKRLLARYLVNRRPKSIAYVSRHYRLGSDFSIEDSVDGLPGAKLLRNVRHFSAIHMASQGYWQRADDDSWDSDS